MVTILRLTPDTSSFLSGAAFSSFLGVGLVNICPSSVGFGLTLSGGRALEHIGKELPSKLKVGFALSQERIMRTSGRKRVYRSEN